MDFFLAGCFPKKNQKGARPRTSRGLPTKAALHEARKAAPIGRVPWHFVHIEILVQTRKFGRYFQEF
jgi:hypothetical protein